MIHVFLHSIDIKERQATSCGETVKTAKAVPRSGLQPLPYTSAHWSEPHIYNQPVGLHNDRIKPDGTDAEMSIRPTVTIAGADGTPSGSTHPLPAVFKSPIRPDIVQ